MFHHRAYSTPEISVLDDLCGSNHFSIVLSLSPNNSTSTPPLWKLHYVDWTKFQCVSQLSDLGIGNISADTFYRFTLFTLLHSCFYPQSSENRKVGRKLRFTDKFKKAIRQRKKDLRAFRCSPTTDNLATLSAEPNPPLCMQYFMAQLCILT